LQNFSEEKEQNVQVPRDIQRTGIIIITDDSVRLATKRFNMMPITQCTNSCSTRPWYRLWFRL